MITVVGEHAGREVVSFALAHGEDPVAGLGARGWDAQVEAVEGVLGDLTFRYAVVPTEEASIPASPRSTRSCARWPRRPARSSTTSG